MTPEQGARYQRLLTLWMEYWETGNGFGGRYFRDFDLEADLQGAISSFCDEVNGWVNPPPRKPPMAFGTLLSADRDLCPYLTYRKPEAC